MKTNAVRILEELGIAYELREYEVDPKDLNAEKVAQKIGLPAEQTFKTLVVKGDREGVCFAVIPGSSELDLKNASQAEWQPQDGPRITQGGVTSNRLHSRWSYCSRR